MSQRFSLPQQPGGYRWYYADAVAGEWTAVFIFMVGAVFSPRYSVAARRGASPRDFCAVNLALYRQGRRRAWVFSEYGPPDFSGDSLRIGNSHLEYAPNGKIQFRVDDRRAPFGGRIQAELDLTPTTPEHEEVALVQGEPHFWQPLAARAEAVLKIPTFGVEESGHGYHDTNHGHVPLGEGVGSWYWIRTHRPKVTEIHYAVRGQPSRLRVVASESQIDSQWEDSALIEEPSGWGLQLPRTRPEQMLESSPFYARMESRGDQLHQLGEVADFHRFHQPHLRWMAHFRMRRGAA